MDAPTRSSRFLINSVDNTSTIADRTQDNSNTLGTVPTLFKMTDPLKTFALEFLKLAFDVAVIQ